MRHLNIPDPPDPNGIQYKGNALAWQRASFDWMKKLKGVVQDSHNQLSNPCGQQFIASAFTTNTTATGTTTGTDLSNVVASLVQTLTQGGVLSPTISRNQNQ